MTRLIVLDRDGVINRDSDAFVRSVSEFAPLPGAIAAMAALSRTGLKVAVCTNQSGLGRGLFSQTDLEEIHAEMERLVREAGGRIHALRYCPHLPGDECDCRKPKPGMLLALMAELGESPENTVFVGDSLRDMEAARAAGCRAVLVRTGNGARDEAAAQDAGVQEVYDDLAAFASAEIEAHNEGSKSQQ